MSRSFTKFRWFVVRNIQRESINRRNKTVSRKKLESRKMQAYQREKMNTRQLLDNARH